MLEKKEKIVIKEIEKDKDSEQILIWFCFDFAKI